MKKSFLSLFAIATLIFSLYGQSDSIRYLPALSPDRIMLSFPDNPSTSFGVTWRTAFNITAGYGEITEISPSPTLEKTVRKVEGTNSAWEEGSDMAMGHKVIFSGLKPDTKYVYRVGDGTNWSEWLQIKTASDRPEPFSFIYFGDVQNNIKEYCSRNLRQAYAHQPDAAFMVFAGDLVSRSTEEYWREFFYAGGHVFKTVPSVATPGNHEYYKDSETGKRTFSKHWNQIFINPDNGPEPLKNQAYYLDYQGARIISLDSYHISSNKEYSQQQLEWFENVLKTNNQKWTIVTFHYPVFSCSKGRNNITLQKELKPILEKYGVDLVLQGHDHSYCRGFHLDSIKTDCKNPPMYVVSVTGAKMYGLGTLAKHDRVASMTQLYQIVDIEGDKLTFNAYTVAGDLYDSFNLIKTNAGRNEFVENPLVKEIEQKVEIPERYYGRYSAEEKRLYEEFYNTKIPEK